MRRLLTATMWFCVLALEALTVYSAYAESGWEAAAWVGALMLFFTTFFALMLYGSDL